MDRSSHLILKNNIDVTSNVVFCQYNNTTKRYDVTFKNGTTYSCAYHTIEGICKPESVSPLDVRILLHGNELWGIQSIDHPLHMLIRNTDRMTAKECHYALNPATHLDFLIYSQISKEPVLAIEVDGFHYHKKGTKQYNRDQLKTHIL